MPTPTEPASTQPLILFVEDYVDAREILTVYLTTLGFDVHEARDGHEALELMARHAYDVIILDLALPRLDGWEFMRIHNRLRSRVPIIVHSAHVSGGHRSLAEEYGHRFLEKPTDLKALETAVRDAIESKPTSPRIEPRQMSDASHRPPPSFDRLTRALSEVVGGACHDMANSLAVVRAYVEAPERWEDETAMPRTLRQMADQVQELHRFVRLFYRTDAEPYEAVRCRDLRKQIRKLLPPGAGTPVVQVRCDSNDVSVPPILLRLIIAPLVTNSLEAAHAHGRGDKLKVHIDVHVLPHKEGVLFRVRDNGPGFGAVLPELTRALAAGRPFSTKGTSRGYGLTHLARLIKVLHGRIEVAEGPNGGSSVQIRLPLEGD